VRGRPVELSVHALTALLRKENLGDPHPVLAGGEAYVSPRFADAVDQALRDALDEAGLGQRDARDEFLAALAHVQQAPAEYFGWVTTTDGSYAVLVAASAHRAVLLTREGESVQVKLADRKEPIETLVRQLPDVRAGHGESMSVPEMATAAGRRAGGVMRRAAAARPEQARLLDQLLAAPRFGLAKLYTARRDENGRVTRSRDWINVIDVVGNGRWLVYPTLGRGERSVNAVAGTPQLLVAKLTELAATT
jgi:ESX secretion-associated protein EspG